MSIDRARIQWNGWGWTAAKDTLAERDEVWTWLAAELGMPSLLATPARPLAEISLAPSRLTDALRHRFAEMLGNDRVRTDDYERAFHAYGRSYHDLLRMRLGDLSAAPDAVLFPRAASEVQSALDLCNENSIAVVPYGGGTSVVGGVTGQANGFPACVTMDLSGMGRMLNVDTVSRIAEAEAGIYGPALEKELQSKGVTLGHYPQSFEFSTLGGWIGHRGAGQNSVRYGKAENWLVAAKMATPAGMMETPAFPASAAGPRLSDLMVGSEGTLGIITEATFKVRAIPEAIDYCGYLFHDFATGVAAIREAVQTGISVAMLRLSDPEETRFYRAFGTLGKKRSAFDGFADAVLKYRNFGPGACALIAGFEDTDDAVRANRARFARIARNLGAMNLGKAQGERWRAGRFHGPYMREPMMNRAVGVDTLETATHWSNIDRLHAAVRSALNTAIERTAPRPGAKGIVMCHVSHAYTDGASLYYTMIFPRALDGEIAQWKEIKTAASNAISAHGGTISHHHGVGEDHLPWIEAEKGALSIEALRAAKRALDPKGIMNPGKLIPPTAHP
ncbi:MAG: FAD-binding protein [Alphaproteobacteria bacterium]|nr:FAD-binding protein [Alphaproteobacteria bacterium]